MTIDGGSVIIFTLVAFILGVIVGWAGFAKIQRKGSSWNEEMVRERAEGSLEWKEGYDDGFNRRDEKYAVFPRGEEHKSYALGYAWGEIKRLEEMSQRRWEEKRGSGSIVKRLGKVIGRTCTGLALLIGGFGVYQGTSNGIPWNEAAILLIAPAALVWLFGRGFRYVLAGT